MVGAMSTKGLTIALSVVIGAIALVVGVMAVGAMPLGADRPHISNADYARRTAAADKLQGRIEALANDVPPALPEVPERLTADTAASDVANGTTGGSTAVPQGATPDATAIPDQQAPAAGDDGEWHDDGGYGDDSDHDGEHGERGDD